MTRAEALQNALTGKKMYHVDLDSLKYFYWCSETGCFRSMDNRGVDCPLWGIPKGYPQEGWEIYREKVEFNIAIEAWRKGSAILCCGSNETLPASPCKKADPIFYLSEIEGKWEILD